MGTQHWYVWPKSLRSHRLALRDSKQKARVRARALAGDSLQKHSLSSNPLAWN